MGLLATGPAGTLCDVPEVTLGLIQNEPETARTPSYDLLAFLSRAQFVDGQSRWRVQPQAYPAPAGAPPRASVPEVLVIGYNAIHLDTELKRALKTAQPTEHVLVLHQLTTDCLDFLRGQLRVALREIPGGAANEAWVPRERLRQAHGRRELLHEPLLNWPRPFEELAGRATDALERSLTAKTLRWLSFEPGSAWRVVLEVQRGSQHLPVLVRTSELERQRVVVCTLLLEPRLDPAHASLVENMVTYVACGWPEVAVLDGNAMPQWYCAPALARRLRAQGTRAIRVVTDDRVLERWPLAGVQRIVVPDTEAEARAWEPKSDHEWFVGGGTLVRAAEKGVTIHARASDSRWVARRWAMWFNGTRPSRWLTSIFAARGVLQTLAVLNKDEEADKLGLGAEAHVYKRRIASLLAARVSGGSVEETIGTTAAAYDLNRLVGGGAVTTATKTQMRRWLAARFKKASPEDKLDIARCLRQPELLQDALDATKPDDVSATYAVRLRQAAVALAHAEKAIPNVAAQCPKVASALEDPRIARELSTSPLLAAEFVATVFECRRAGSELDRSELTALGKLGAAQDTALEGMMSLRGLTGDDLEELGPWPASIEARALVGWLEGGEGLAFELRPEGHRLPVRAVESVLRETRAARAQEEQALEDAPKVGTVAHVLGTLALVGAGLVLAALLKLDVTIGTTASWVAAGAVAVIGALLTAAHVVTRARTGDRRDLLLAQTVLGAITLIATVAVGVVLVDAIPATAVAVAATLAVAIGAAVILGRLGMAAPWLSAVYRFLSDPKAMLESAGRRRS